MTGLTGDAPYLNCPRCGLSIALKSYWLTIRHCPRCLGRNRTLVELFRSPLPAHVLYADNSLPHPDPRLGSPPTPEPSIAAAGGGARARARAHRSHTIEVAPRG